jgi:hypothetical protein
MTSRSGLPALLVVVEIEATEPRFFLYARSPQDEDALHCWLARAQDELAAIELEAAG